MTGKEMREENHGHAVKPRWSRNPEPQKTKLGGQTWEDAVKANEKILDGMIERSHAFIKKCRKKHGFESKRILFRRKG